MANARRYITPPIMITFVYSINATLVKNYLVYIYTASLQIQQTINIIKAEETTQLRRKATWEKGPPTEPRTCDLCSIVEFHELRNCPRSFVTHPPFKCHIRYRLRPVTSKLALVWGMVAGPQAWDGWCNCLSVSSICVSSFVSWYQLLKAEETLQLRRKGTWKKLR